MNTLDGKVALVTGASRGIGAAIASALAQAGAYVLVHYGRSRSDANTVVAQIEQAGGQATVIQADLSSDDEVHLLWNRIDAALHSLNLPPQVDVIVNNAGINLRGRIEDVEPQQLDQHLAVNLKAPFFVTKMGLPRLRDNGRIINISSGSARYARPDIIGYAMTKGAIEVFTRTLAAQVGSRGITVNAVAPSVIDTDLNQVWLHGDEEAKQRAGSQTAFGTIAVPEDVAAIVTFLASAQSQWITGQTIDATGGNRL
ncbi:SDR family NAD(P)-dependent oxidoreductase [Nocardia sp. 348MFTsu5.1]|uniref:SDR family NAD(P)-dependent oxidoreductase n=1 Tax=Nocardia sp. 348MFTsu5.1 TaxID=1172185 RepID=UPI00035D28A6|nr:SDR family oxidoreductase [Nocardia sp. 348MFTsu5.1]